MPAGLLGNRTALDFDLIIVGAGLAGASFAAALKNSRLRIALIEHQAPAAPAAGWDSRIYAINPAAQRFLEEIGLWRHLDEERLTPVHDMAIHGDGGGRLDFSAWDSGVDRLAWILEAGLLQRELRESLKRQDNLTLFCPAQPRHLETTADAVLLQLTSDQTLRARLLVGADGADSWVRARAGLAARLFDYGAMGVVANFACEKPHRNTAFQWFRADGVLAWLPLPAERVSMVWSTPRPRAQALLEAAEADLCRQVAAAGQQRLGALKLLGRPAAFALRRIRVPRIVAPRLALIGDAAHGIHPLSGHGINLGLIDARELARALSDRPEFVECGDQRALRRYERARAEEVALLQWTTHGLHRLFEPQQAALSALRNHGLNLVNQLPVLRNTLVRYALG